MRILSHKEVKSLFTMEDAFAAVLKASIQHDIGSDLVPKRMVFVSQKPELESLIMPGLISGRYFGMKVWYSLPEGVGELPRSAAYISLFDLEQGTQALIEASTITDFRTGAMTGVVVGQVFAGKSPSTMGVIGSGIQARTQILAVLHALPSVKEVKVFARNQDRLRKFIEEMETEITQVFNNRKVAFLAESDAENACNESDIVIAATTSPQPVVFNEWLKSGDVFVASVGSHSSDEIELDPQIVQQAKSRIVDTIAGGVNGAGDFGHLVDSGLIPLDSIRTIGQVMQSQQSFSGLTVLKTVGFAAADLYAAELVLHRAESLAAGKQLEFY